MEDKIFTAELLVPTVSDIVGKSVKDLTLMNIGHGRLLGITGLDDELVGKPDGEQVVLGGDRLIYSGTVDEILKMREQYSLATSEKYRTTANEMNPMRQTKTAVVDEDCPLVGNTVNGCEFEKENHLIIMAICRNNEMLEYSPRNVVIKAGDILLIDRKPKGKGSFIKGLQFHDIEKHSMWSVLKKWF